MKLQKDFANWLNHDMRARISSPQPTKSMAPKLPGHLDIINSACQVLQKGIFYFREREGDSVVVDLHVELEGPLGTRVIESAT